MLRVVPIIRNDQARITQFQANETDVDPQYLICKVTVTVFEKKI